jgi:hypothetical protein
LIISRLTSKRVSAIVLNLGSTIPILGVRNIPPPLFFGGFIGLRKATFSFVVSVCLSVRLEQVALTRRIFVKFDIRVVLDNTSRKFKFRGNLTSIALLYTKTNIHF